MNNNILCSVVYISNEQFVDENKISQQLDIFVNGLHHNVLLFVLDPKTECKKNQIYQKNKHSMIKSSQTGFRETEHKLQPKGINLHNIGINQRKNPLIELSNLFNLCF